MPYEIKKSGEGFKVFKKGTSKAFSKSPMTKKEADAQLKALYANTNEGIVNEEDNKTYYDELSNDKNTYLVKRGKNDITSFKTELAAKQHAEKLNKMMTAYRKIPSFSKDKTNEASTLTKVARKILWDKIRTPKEFATQVKALPDKTLIVWAKDAEKNKGIPNTPLAFQQKLVKIEMAKRGLTTNSTGMPFENKNNTMKKSELTNMIQEIIKEVINESSNTTPKHIIIAQLMGPDFFLSKKPESKWDEKDHELFNRLYKMASETGSVPKMTESADYDTAVAFRLVAKDNRDAALLALQKEIEKVTGPSGRFSKVKVTIIPSKGNPQDIIIKLNGPSAFSMGKDITAKDKTKAYTNPTIRNNFSKVSPYTPQLTKIS